MPGGIVTLLGGLAVWVEVSFYPGDGWTTDDDAAVDAVYWLKKDGTKGSEFSPKMYDRLDKWYPYWEADAIETVSEYLAYQAYLATHPEEKSQDPFSSDIEGIA